MEIKDADEMTVDVLLDIGCPLVAAITRKSVAVLKLTAGQRLSAHIKSVAFLEELTE